MKASGIGGQAVIEGVMMKNKSEYAIAVRKPNNEIIIIKDNYFSVRDKFILFKLPFLRGIFTFIDSLIIGVRTLSISANIIEEEEAKGSKVEKTIYRVFKEKAEAVVMGFTVLLATILAVVIFLVLPYLAAEILKEKITSTPLKALVEGVVRIAIFIIYVIMISQMKDVKRVFKYHGAEHKVINCIENGLELNLKNVRKQSKRNKRCGTSFMLIVMFFSVMFFIFIDVPDMWVRMGMRLLLVPVIAGVSYEFLRIAAKSNSKLIGLLSIPAIILQALTTREPDDAMIEVAIESVEAVFDWRNYLLMNGYKGERSSMNDNFINRENPNSSMQYQNNRGNQGAWDEQNGWIKPNTWENAVNKDQMAPQQNPRQWEQPMQNPGMKPWGQPNQNEGTKPWDKANSWEQQKPWEQPGTFNNPPQNTEMNAWGQPKQNVESKPWEQTNAWERSIPKPEAKPWEQAMPKQEPKPWEQPVPRPELKPWEQPMPKAEPKPWEQPVPRPETKPWEQSVSKPEPRPWEQNTIKSEPKPWEQAVSKAEPKPWEQPVSKSEPRPWEQAASKPEPKPWEQAMPKTEPKPWEQPVSKVDAKPWEQAVPKAEARPWEQAVSKSEPKPWEQAASKKEPKPWEQAVPKSEPKPWEQPVAKQEPRPWEQSMPKSDLKPWEQAIPKSEPRPWEQAMKNTEPKPWEQSVQRNEQANADLARGKNRNLAMHLPNVEEEDDEVLKALDEFFNYGRDGKK